MMNSDADGETRTESASEFMREIERTKIWHNIFKAFNYLLVLYGVASIFLTGPRGITEGAVLIFGGQITNCLLVLKKEAQLRMIIQERQISSEAQHSVT